MLSHNNQNWEEIGENCIAYFKIKGNSIPEVKFTHNNKVRYYTEYKFFKKDEGDFLLEKIQ